ncbi:MAG: hypothetical protein HN392_05430 [Anaerolineae bacterium]|jgi:uncharacterized protein YkwD|nr:hypothetical protein [Anaerolineae bacterium]MBT7074912.1 hypothetical protein [Anaerolineae bacterium]MBT7782088.1 hypothetical protein [Anaerolineae bacterium]
MNKKVFPLILLMALSLSACGTATPTATAVATEEPPTATLLAATEAPTEVPLVTETPLVTAIPVDPPTSAPTATLPPPVNAADCTNLGKFISDVTIPDNSEVNIGEAFTKIWRIQNTGTCIWWEGYSVAHYSEGSFDAAETTPLPRTNPGETADISVDLVSPELAGFYRGNFVVQNPLGLYMEIEGDSRLWLIFNAVDNGEIIVEATSTLAATAPVVAETVEVAACEAVLEDTRLDGVFASVNTYRVENGLTLYPINQALSDAAQAHAVDIACNNLFVHTGSDGSTAQERATAAGYTFSVTENVYGSNPPLTPEGVKEWWRLDTVDPTHGENLLSTEYTEMGIGYAFFDGFGYYVAVFGKGE